MTGFAKKMKTKREWCSDPFFTDTKGYRILLEVYVCGIGDYEGTHCSIFVNLMRGRNDDS